MIITLRDNPQLMRTALGIRVYASALAKMKGTHWETLFAKDYSKDPELVRFRAECDRVFGKEVEPPRLNSVRANRGNTTLPVYTCPRCAGDTVEPSGPCWGCSDELKLARLASPERPDGGGVA